MILSLDLNPIMDTSQASICSAHSIAHSYLSQVSPAAVIQPVPATATANA